MNTDHCLVGSGNKHLDLILADHHDRIVHAGIGKSDVLKTNNRKIGLNVV
jgi:hypothetical protein